MICTSAERQRPGPHLNTYPLHGTVGGVWLVVPWSRRYLSWVWPFEVVVGINRRLRWAMDLPPAENQEG